MNILLHEIFKKAKNNDVFYVSKGILKEEWNTRDWSVLRHINIYFTNK